MVRPRWQKVLRDLSLYKTRTVLVVLSIAVGVFAFGTIMAARENILHELRSSFLSINPASAIITTEPFDDDLVDAVRHMPKVAAAEGQRRVAARAEIAPDVWYDLDLFVLPDDGNISVDIIRPEEGAWPPPDKAVLIERASLPKLNAQVNDVITVEMAGGEQRTLPIVGLTHDLSLPPAPIAGKAFGYISFETLTWLGGPDNYHHIYDQVKFVVAEQPLNEEHIWQVAVQVADKIERSGREVDVIDVPSPPQQHPAEMVIPTILIILGGLGGMALLLGGFLILNTIEAILTQQIKQIGILKAVGTRSRQIRQLYFGMALIFGLLALLLAVPLGTLGAWRFSLFMSSQLNVDIDNFRMPAYVLVLEAAAALLLPVLASLPAIRAAVRVSVREALSNDGTASDEGSGFINRLFQRIRGVPRPLLLSLRNTFRRKGRLIRTLVVLLLGGAIFISVLTVRQSLFHTLEATTASKQYDIEMRLARPYRLDYLAQQLQQVPGVVAVEGWGAATAYPLRPDGSEGEEIKLNAPPADTRLLDLTIEQGRWLKPDDRRAIVLSSNYLNKEPGTSVGDSIMLDIKGKEYTWQIVGISREFVSPVNPAIGYVPFDAFVRTAGQAGSVSSVRIVTQYHSPNFQARVAQAIEEHTDAIDLQVRLIRTLSEDSAMMHERFNILTAVLSIMAALIGIVGGLGLMGTMSINVIERTREIGIMRAVGASDGAIQQIVIVEGVLIGLIAWLGGVLVSVPLSILMSIQIGRQLLNEPLIFSYAAYAVLLWLGVVVVVAILASYVPARNASRLTIREVLAYE